KRIHTMETDARQLREAIARMAFGRDTADSFIANWLEQQVLHYSLVKRRYNECQTRYLKEKQQQHTLRENLTVNEQAIAGWDQRRSDVGQLLLAVYARRLGVPASRDKDQLLADRQVLESQIPNGAPALLKLEQQLQFTAQAAQPIIHALRHSSISLALPV